MFKVFLPSRSFEFSHTLLASLWKGTLRFITINLIIFLFFHFSSSSSSSCLGLVLSYTVRFEVYWNASLACLSVCIVLRRYNSSPRWLALLLLLLLSSSSLIPVIRRSDHYTVDFLHPKLSFPPCPSSLSSSASSQLVILRLSPPIFFHIALFLPFVHVSCGSHSKILHNDRLLGIPFTRTNHHNRIVYLFIYLLAQLCPYLFTWLCNLAYPLTPHKRFISVIMCFLWLLSFVIEFLRLFVLSDAHVVEL